MSSTLEQKKAKTTVINLKDISVATVAASNIVFTSSSTPSTTIANMTSTTIAVGRAACKTLTCSYLFVVADNCTLDTTAGSDPDNAYMQGEQDSIPSQMFSSAIEGTKIYVSGDCKFGSGVVAPFIIKRNYGINTISYKRYEDSTTQSTTVTTTISSAVSTSYSWSATVRDGYEISGDSSGTGTVRSSVVISPVTSGKSYTITVTNGYALSTTYSTSESKKITTTLGTSRPGWIFDSYGTPTGASRGTPTISGNTLTIPADTYGNISISTSWTANSYTLSTSDAKSVTSIQKNGTVVTSYAVSESDQTFTVVASKGGYSRAFSTTGAASSLSGTTLTIPGTGAVYTTVNKGYGNVKVTTTWTANTYTVSSNDTSHIFVGKSAQPSTTSFTYTIDESSAIIGYWKYKRDGYILSSISSDTDPESGSVSFVTTSDTTSSKNGNAYGRLTLSSGTYGSFNLKATETKKTYIISFSKPTGVDDFWYKINDGNWVSTASTTIQITAAYQDTFKGFASTVIASDIYHTVNYTQASPFINSSALNVDEANNTTITTILSGASAFVANNNVNVTLALPSGMTSGMTAYYKIDSGNWTTYTASKSLGTLNTTQTIKVKVDVNPWETSNYTESNPYTWAVRGSHDSSQTVSPGTAGYLNTYTITVESEDTRWGSVGGTVTYTYSYASTQTKSLSISATARDGFSFNKWQITSGPEGGTASISGTTLTLTGAYGNITIQATFTLNYITLDHFEISNSAIATIQYLN